MNRRVSGFTVIALVFSALSAISADSIAWWHGYCSECPYHTEKIRGPKPDAQKCPYEGANGVKCSGLVTFRQCNGPGAIDPWDKSERQREAKHKAKVKRITKQLLKENASTVGKNKGG